MNNYSDFFSAKLSSVESLKKFFRGFFSYFFSSTKSDFQWSDQSNLAVICDKKLHSTRSYSVSFIKKVNLHNLNRIVKRTKKKLIKEPSVRKIVLMLPVLNEISSFSFWFSMGLFVPTRISLFLFYYYRNFQFYLVRLNRNFHVWKELSANWQCSQLIDEWNFSILLPMPPHLARPYLADKGNFHIYRILKRMASFFLMSSDWPLRLTRAHLLVWVIAARETAGSGRESRWRWLSQQ